MTAQTLTTGKVAEILFENALETFETQDKMLDLVMFWEPDGGALQNADNVIWRPVEQHAPIISGWDLAGLETGIIEETYPAVLGTPSNDYVQLRADKMRDRRFWERRGIASGRRQVSNLNKATSDAMINQGSMFYTSTTTSGFNFISEAQALMDERQISADTRCFLLNDRDTQFYSTDLAARQTLQGQPEKTWRTGQIGQNIASFDIYKGSFLSALDGGTSPNTQANGNQSFAPSAGSVNTSTGVVTNVDYREADITVVSTTGYTVGDKLRMRNVDTGYILAIGLDDKTETVSPMTFTVVDVVDATTLTIFPKPIAADDSALSTIELAYANVDTTIKDDCSIERVNTATSAQANLFWQKDAVEILGGSVPASLFKEFGGKKVIQQTMKNGLTMYLLYDGNIEDMTFSFRLFVWYGITVAKPQEVGVALRSTAT